jgi:hypothetical protein
MMRWTPLDVIVNVFAYLLGSVIVIGFAYLIVMGVAALTNSGCIP